ncbi:polysaccharide deacetylase family protein [Alicyclobacillus macrosporangiidus]|uniref:Tetratricopeptide repeat-containing protein n=1 Tax=Alicyclobacillus macrosporangiidus TaxID=392015 RepID=A0A1I7L0A9_9BACL|nr:polysaccharide deacetylase family protein [Alicyclobacillus macrosporangiidus]SFV03140.1 Tetratricopeptide repeat-containing protein [Alicyclobacillus macrosporangiidus]
MTDRAVLRSRWNRIFFCLAAALSVAGCSGPGAAPATGPANNASPGGGNRTTGSHSAPAAANAASLSHPAGHGPGEASGLKNPAWIADPVNYSPAGAAANHAAPANPNLSVPILEYHEANYVPGNVATLKPGQLEAEFQWLSDHGFHTINFGQLYAALYQGYRLPSRPVLLTFDDGYESVYLKVFPLLKRYHFQATVFAVSGFTHDQPNRDKPFPTMTVSELQELQASGLVDVENHTATHADLSKLSADEQRREIDGAAAFLENIVHHPIRFFCYPNGDYGDQTVDLLRQSGYLLAVTQHQGYANLSQGPLTLHRLTVLESTTLSEFAAMLRPSLSEPTQTLPQSLMNMHQQASQAFSNHRYSDTIRLENQVIADDPGYAPAYNLRGIAELYAGQIQQGQADIDHALQLDPGFGYAKFNKALGLELTGRYDEAIRAYQDALASGRGEWWIPWCDYGIASIYGRRGDVENTVRYLREAISLDPSCKTEARTEHDFDPVRASAAFQALIR